MRKPGSLVLATPSLRRVPMQTAAGVGRAVLLSSSAARVWRVVSETLAGTRAAPQDEQEEDGAAAAQAMPGRSLSTGATRPRTLVAAAVGPARIDPATTIAP
jgi:hypothetical protein